VKDDFVLPADLVLEVEMWADKQIEDSINFVNREPLDESGIFTLHRLAASIYARGWGDGARAEGERLRGVGRRERAAQRREEQAE